MIFFNLINKSKTSLLDSVKINSSGAGPKIPPYRPKSPEKSANTVESIQTELKPISVVNITQADYTEKDHEIPQVTTTSPSDVKPMLPQNQSLSTSIAKQAENVSPGYYGLGQTTPKQNSWSEESTNEYLYDRIEPKDLSAGKTTAYYWADLKNTNMQIPNHEKQHTALIEEKEDGTRIYSVYATSQKNNSVSKNPNLDFGSPQIRDAGIKKSQRFSTYVNPRYLDNSVKENVDYTKEQKAEAYYAGLSETRKEELKNLSQQGTQGSTLNSTRIFINRTSPNSTSNLNDMGYKEDYEYSKPDFHEGQNND